MDRAVSQILVSSPSWPPISTAGRGIQAFVLWDPMGYVKLLKPQQITALVLPLASLAHFLTDSQSVTPSQKWGSSAYMSQN